jgi:uncharacterized membrane protein YvbJ
MEEKKEETKTTDTAEIIDNTKDVAAKPKEEKCPYCGAKVDPLDQTCPKCKKPLRDKKADKQRAINDGTYHDIPTMIIAIATGSILIVFIVIAIIGFVTKGNN